ncbi:MAG: AMP-binding protein [Candidatus Thermoplasmatota archaeon]|nr:AMP-binding protein [Candidatus Thermoplasmatota archaeon]
MDFDPIERYREMTGSEIQRVQERKLRDYIRYQLYPFSPYYNRLFDEKGIDPNSIMTLKDLETIPLTRKSDIMPDASNPKRYKDFILQPDPEKIRKHWPRSKLIGLKVKDIIKGDLAMDLHREYYPTFMIATSGTTGNNVPFMFSERDIKQFSNIYASLTEVTKLDMKWVVLNTFPFAPHLAFIFVYFVNLYLPLRMFHTGGGAVTSTLKTLEVVKQVDANVLIGIPSYIYHLLRKAQEKGTDLSSIRLVVTAGEKLSMSTRKRITEILKERGATDFKIFDVYGTTEMRDAYPECTPGKGVFHIHPNMHICEIVDPETGKQKKEGESGALAVTNIDGRGSVICRFLIGDIFEGGIQYGKCPHCGREGPRLVGPIGRIRDYHRSLELTNVKGTLLNLNAFYDIMPTIDGIDEWQVSIEKKNNDPSDLDMIRVKVAPKEGIDMVKLEKEIKERVNDSIEINPVVDAHYTMDELFEEMGGKIKVQRIVDTRAP